MKKKKKVKYVAQLIPTECGACCIVMILNYYGANVKLKHIREYLDVGRDGTKIKDVKKCLEVRGFNSKIYRCPVEGLRQITLPAILYWEEKHYIVLEQLDKDEAIIVDPAMGRRKITFDKLREGFSNYVVVAQKTDRFVPERKEKNVWFKYGYLLFQNKPLLLALILCSLVSYTITLLFPMIIQRVIDHLISYNEVENNLLLITGILVVLYSIVFFVNGMNKINIELGVYKSICVRFFKHMLSLPYKYFQNTSNGDLLFRVESLSIVKNLYSDKLLTLFIDFGIIIAILSYTAVKSIYIAALLLLVLILVGILTKFCNNKILEKNSYEIVEMSKLQSQQIEMVYSVQDIKIAGIEDTIYKKWKLQYDLAMSRGKERQEYENVYASISNFVNTIGPIMILFVGVALSSQKLLSIGEITSIYSLTGNLFGTSVKVFMSLNNFKLSSQYLERIDDVSETEEEKDGVKVINDTLQGSIEIKNLSFRYNKNSSPVLEDISLNVMPGEKVAFVGSSGSGKSTLSKLLLGLYEPTEGSIFIDHEDITILNKSVLRQKMGVVSQDIALMNKSIMDNITVGRDDITLEQVKKACGIVQLDEEIEAMPMKYNTLITDMGMNLSGGQRQRIALARALVTSPKILILDEATSSLDAIKENKISEYLSSVGCTRVVIAHRLSTIIDADVIYVFSNGRIVEKGTHDVLIRKEGYYYQLYTKQLSSSEYEAV